MSGESDVGDEGGGERWPGWICGRGEMERELEEVMTEMPCVLMPRGLVGLAVAARIGKACRSTGDSAEASTIGKRSCVHCLLACEKERVRG